MEPKTGRRIVSKREYVRIQTKRIKLWLLAGCMGFLGMVALLAGRHPEYMPSIPAPIGFCFWILYAVALFWIALKIAQRVRAIESVVPLTRANTADLLATESLVRASSESEQAQETVLLRAAQGVDTPAEELVRASAGRE